MPGAAALVVMESGHQDQPGLSESLTGLCGRYLRDGGKRTLNVFIFMLTKIYYIQV